MVFKLLRRTSNEQSHARLRKLARARRTSGQARRVDVDGVEVECWLAGDGVRTIVFIHGNSASKEVFSEQFSRFADEGCSLLAFDLPGHGGSEDAAVPELAYTIPSYALLAKRLFDKFDIRRPIVVGWSLGGHIALEMAGRGFSLAGALICGTPPVGPGLEDAAAAFRPSEAGAVTTKRDAKPAEIRTYAKALYGSLNPIPELFFRAAERTDGQARARMGAHWAAGEEGCHQRTVAAGWAGPICVVHGAQDAFISGNYLRTIVWRNLWSGRIHEFAGSGHAPFIEEPLRFNEILHKFMMEAAEG